jgi:hypothetical protein
VSSWVRSVLSLSKRLWCNATAKLERLVALARQIRKLAQPAPEVVAPTVVQRLGQELRRRSYGDRAALRRSRRVGPPKDETQDVPLAA